MSVVKLYAGAFFPGIMLAGLYIGLRDRAREVAPRPDAAAAFDRAPRWPLPPFAQRLAPQGGNALAGLWRAAVGWQELPAWPRATVLGELFVTLIPALFIAATAAVTWQFATTPETLVDTSGLVEAGAR